MGLGKIADVVTTLSWARFHGSCSGTQICVLPGKLNPAGMTPITVNGFPFTVIERPTTSCGRAEPAANIVTEDGDLDRGPVCSLRGRNVRPYAAIPSNGKNSAVTSKPSPARDGRRPPSSPRHPRRWRLVRTNGSCRANLPARRGIQLSDPPETSVRQTRTRCALDADMAAGEAGLH